MDAIRKCSQIFECSAKKQGLLEGNIKAIMPEENKEKLLNVCRTRWVQRLEGLERVHELFKPIIKTLEDIKDNHDGSFKADARTDANGVHATFLSFDFVVNLIIVRHILAYITPLTTELQKSKMDIKAVYDAVDNVVRTLKFCRGNVDEKHDKWFIEAENFVTAIDMDIDVKKPRYASRQKNRDNYLTTTVSEYYKLSLTIPLLDTIISEFESRTQ